MQMGVRQDVLFYVFCANIIHIKIVLQYKLFTNAHCIKLRRLAAFLEGPSFSGPAFSGPAFSTPPPPFSYCRAAVNSFSTRRLSSYTDEYAHTHDIFNY